MTIRTAKVYDIIDGKAGSNVAMQGLSGLMGFPFTAVMDIAVFFTHYGPMLNDIRAVYNRPPIGKDELHHIVKGCRQDLLADMVLDKLIGNIPILGLPANMICARAMTWRLGLLFGMLSACGDEINSEHVLLSVRLIQSLFPQTDSLLFKKPTVLTVEKLLSGVEDAEPETFSMKVQRALDQLAS